MRKLLCFTAAVLLANLGFAQSSTAAIKKADNDRSQAIVKGDLAAVDKATADTYVFTDSTGRVTEKTELMNELKTGSLKVQSQDSADVKVQIYGNTAVETGKISGNLTQNGQSMSGTFRFTRVWVNHNGTWQTVAFQETRSQ